MWVTLSLRTSEDKIGVNNLQMADMNLSRYRQRLNRYKNCQLASLNNEKHNKLALIKEPKEQALKEYNDSCTTLKEATEALNTAKKNAESTVKGYGYSDGVTNIYAGNKDKYDEYIEKKCHSLDKAISLSLVDFIEYLNDFNSNDETRGTKSEQELAEEFEKTYDYGKDADDNYKVSKMLENYADKIQEYRENHPELDSNLYDSEILKDHILEDEYNKYESFKGKGEDCYKVPGEKEGVSTLIPSSEFESEEHLKSFEDAVESAKIEKEMKYTEYNAAKEEYEIQKAEINDNYDYEVQSLEEETNEEENQLDMEQTQIETQLEALKQELESVKQSVSQEIQGSTIKLA